MAIMEPLVTSAAGALFATAGVVVGGAVTRKALSVWMGGALINPENWP